MLQTFEVANVRCGGCANSITQALENAGFKEIYVDLTSEPRKVTVDIESEEQENLFKETLRKLGYPLTSEQVGFTEDSLLKAKSLFSCAVGKIK